VAEILSVNDSTRPHAENLPPPCWRSVGVIRVKGSTKSSISKEHTASILANVFDNIEISTETIVEFPCGFRTHAPTPLNLLVSNKVFDNAAKPVIRNGPKIGWKLDACANDKYVFPNQT